MNNLNTTSVAVLDRPKYRYNDVNVMNEAGLIDPGMQTVTPDKLEFISKAQMQITDF